MFMKPTLCFTTLLLMIHPAVASEELAMPLAGDHRDAEACFQQARASLHGKDAPKGVKKAFELMKLAADQGHPEATGALGYFYSQGIVVEKDERLALEWFRKGAEKGSAKSCLNLGKMLIEGKGSVGTAADALREEGLRWIITAADKRLVEAAYTLGRYHYYGEHGLAHDYGSAARYFKIAADQNDPESLNFLGVMNNLGSGMPQNSAVAEDCFRKAALQGHVKAQANLGMMMNPVSEDKDRKMEALAWLMLAASQGEVTAEKSLADFNPGLLPGDIEQARSQTVELRKSISANRKP